MKVTLFENCKIDRQGTDVIYPSPTPTEMGYLATATYTFENNKRFYMMGDSGVLDIELRDVPAYNCNYMCIEDMDKRYYMFIEGVEKYAGALYELVWTLDVWHTEIDKVQFRNVMISAGHDVGQTRYLIYDNQDTIQDERALDTLIHNTYGCIAVITSEIGYTIFAKPTCTIKELNQICACTGYYEVASDGSTKLLVGQTTGVSCLDTYLLPTEVINKMTETWTYTIQLKDAVRGILPVRGKAKTPTRKSVIPWCGRWQTVTKLNLDPTKNYVYGFKFNNVPLEWQWYRGTNSYSVTIDYLLTQQGISVNLQVNGESYDVTKWFRFTPNYSDAQRQFAGMREANALTALTAGLINPTWKSESTTTRSGGSWVEKSNKTDSYTYTQRRNKKGQFTGALKYDKLTTDSVKTHDVTPRISTATSAITGVDLATTGVAMAINVGRKVVDNLITESLPRNMGGSTDIDALANWSNPFGIWSTTKNDSKQIKDVISMYGYRTKEYFPSWRIDFSTWTEPFKYIQMDSVTLFGIYGDRVETLAQQLYEGVRIYKGVTEYLDINSILPIQYDITLQSNGESVIDDCDTFTEPTFDEVEIKPWQKVYVANPTDFPGGGVTPTPTPGTYPVYLQVNGGSAVKWFEVPDGDWYNIFGALGQNDPFNPGGCTASHGSALEVYDVPPDKYITAVTVDGAPVLATGTAFNSTKYVYITLADKTAPMQASTFKYNDTTGYGLQSIIDQCEFTLSGTGSGNYSIRWYDDGTLKGWMIGVDGVDKYFINISIFDPHYDLLLNGVGAGTIPSITYGAFNYGNDVTMTLTKITPPGTQAVIRLHNALTYEQGNTEINLYCSTEKWEGELSLPTTVKIAYDTGNDCWVLMDSSGNPLYQWFASDIQVALDFSGQGTVVFDIMIGGCRYGNTTPVTIPLTSPTIRLDMEDC